MDNIVVTPEIEPEVAPKTTESQVYYAPDGTLKDGWQTTLPEEYRDEKSLSTIKDTKILAKMFVDTKRMVGKDKIPIPTESSSQEDWDVFYKAGGRPDTADDYQMKRPEELPEEYWNEEFAKSAKQLFHKIGLSKKQADALFQFNTENVLAALKDEQNQKQLQLDELKQGLFTDWGSAYDQKIHLGNMAIEEGTAGDTELKERIVAKLGNDPDFIRFASNLGGKFAEHKSPDFSQVPTPSDLQTQIDEIMHNPLYLNGTTAERNRLAQQVMRLREKMTGTKAGIS